MSNGRWYAPLDPDCPAVAEFEQGADDPIMRMSGCYGEFYESFRASHLRDCERCREYGCANIDQRY